MAVLGSIAMEILLIALRAFTLKYFWAWYVARVFHSLPLITGLQAVGLSMFTLVIKGFSYCEIKAGQDYKAASRTLIWLLFYGFSWIAAGIFNIFLIVTGWHL